ncbi:unnamed protein product [Gongylonema pulchrum]|uniref:NUC153 domain-containing protein n=1 Tax=Gongylonema pulchrum TaxID=637853 RepID=A0A183D3X0_9BILA|nr:unnamed protein product [Gongylonema pulchrum]
MKSLKRPSANDTEEDLLQQQHLLLKKKAEEAKQPKRAPPKSSSVEKSKQLNIRAGRFCLDIDALFEAEAGTSVIQQLQVQERNAEFVDDFDTSKCDEYAREDGFPEVLDLSRYISYIVVLFYNENFIAFFREYHLREEN